jgi:hypothetical protein
MSPGIGEIVDVFQRWLWMPDARAVLAVLGAVQANRLEGDPVWLVLVGPPGGGKSELLQSIKGLPNVYPTATLTEPALLSGTAKKDRDESAKGGLLRSIGDFGIILCKDFGSVLSMHRDGRAAVLAALREIYDGSWTRHLGISGGITLDWEGKVGLIAGATPGIDRHHAVMGAMGERFIFMRIPEVDGGEQARRALDHAGREKEMRAALRAAVAAFFESEPTEPRPLIEDERERLVALASLVVRCRSSFERDSYSREIEVIPDSEAPTRLIIVLERLLAGLDTLGIDRAEAWRVVERVGLDSMPALRRRVLDVLLASADELPTPKIAEATSHPTSTVRRTLQDLAGHGIAERRARDTGEGENADSWRLTDWARAQYVAVYGVPEMSDTPLLLLPNSPLDDKTGTGMRKAAEVG